MKAIVNMNLRPSGQGFEWKYPTWNALGDVDENGNCFVEIPDDIFSGLKNYENDKRFDDDIKFKTIVQHPGDEFLDEHPLIKSYYNERVKEKQGKEDEKIKDYFDIIEVLKKTGIPLKVGVIFVVLNVLGLLLC